MNINEQYSKAIKTEKKALLLYQKAKLHRLRIKRYTLIHPDSSDRVEFVDGEIKEYGAGG